MTESFFPNDVQSEQEPEKQPSEAFPAEPVTAPAADPDDLTEDGRLAAIMSYVPFLCFVPLMNINWKENEEARFHARQGIVLFLIELVAIILLVDDLAKLVFKAILALAAALSVAGIYFALQGKRFRLPIISDFADKAKL
jgi:uncharacterized membrane protein